MGVLVGADGDDRRLGLVELGVEDVGHLRDDRLHVRDVRLAVEVVDGLQLREVGLDAQFEREVLDLAVGRLAVEFARLGVEAKREQ